MLVSKWEKTILNPDFYPTPQTVIDMMQIDCRNQFVYEPSAGSGNLLDWLNSNGAKEVIFSEINEDLANICKSKARFLKHDFLQVKAEEVSHINLIVMNPPFSKGLEHLIHAWDIAPDGCEIISLFNTDTLNSLRYDRREIKYIIDTYGNSFDLGQCFSTAERKTNVQVSCIKLYKPFFNDSAEFEGFYMDAEPEAIQTDGIIKHNEVQALVNSYISASRCFDQFSIINEQMKLFCQPVGLNEGFTMNLSYDKKTANKKDFLIEYQRRCWKKIFYQLKLEKYLTSGVLKDINKFVETQTKIPFTVRNVYKMLEIIIGTQDQNFNKALVEAVDNFTQHTHENRYGVEGWKTNAGHLLNKKFIVNWMCEVKWWGNDKGKLSIKSSSNNDRVNDLIKVICNITATDFNKISTVEHIIKRFDGIESNRWYSCGFFEVKGFKKGTMHFKFTDEKIWEDLNRRYAEIKGQVLPEKF